MFGGTKLIKKHKDLLRTYLKRKESFKLNVLCDNSALKQNLQSVSG